MFHSKILRHQYLPHQPRRCDSHSDFGRQLWPLQIYIWYTVLYESKTVSLGVCGEGNYEKVKSKLTLWECWAIDETTKAEGREEG